MIYKFISVALLSLLLPMVAVAASDRLSLSEKFQVPEGMSAVVSMQEQATIAIIGPINSNVVATYRDLQAKSGANTLFIDSGGGDVASAIELTNDLRKHKTRLVVAGKCFSACANYIFAGAVDKTILPGSLIAIHSSQIQYYLKDSIISVAQRNKQELEKLDSDGNIKKQILANAKLEELFFSSIGLSTENFRIFENYQSRFEKNSKINDRTCRKINLWILSRNELDNMGIKGLKSIWMPSSIQEMSSAATNLHFNPETLFFGSGVELNNACTKK